MNGFERDHGPTPYGVGGKRSRYDPHMPPYFQGPPRDAERGPPGRPGFAPRRSPPPYRSPPRRPLGAHGMPLPRLSAATEESCATRKLFGYVCREMFMVLAGGSAYPPGIEPRGRGSPPPVCAPVFYSLVIGGTWTLAVHMTTVFSTCLSVIEKTDTSWIASPMFFLSMHHSLCWHRLTLEALIGECFRPRRPQNASAAGTAVREATKARAGGGAARGCRPRR